VKLTTYSYRFASEVLNSPAFKKERRDIEGIFGSIVVPQLNPPKLRTRSGKTMTFTTAQKDLNVLLNDEFKKKGWDCQPNVTEDKVTGIKADYKKARLNPLCTRGTHQTRRGSRDKAHTLHRASNPQLPYDHIPGREAGLASLLRMVHSF
jgi:hypothetical protein